MSHYHLNPDVYYSYNDDKLLVCRMDDSDVVIELSELAAEVFMLMTSDMEKEKVWELARSVWVGSEEEFEKSKSQLMSLLISENILLTT